MTHEFRLPDLGEGLTEAEIVEWFVRVGDDVTVDQAIVEIETAKTAVEITATHSGLVLVLGGAPGDTVAVGDVLFVIGDGDDNHQPSAFSRQPEEGIAEGSTRSTTGSLPQLAGGDVPRNEGQRGPAALGHLPRQAGGGPVQAMPIVRKLAKERGVDLATVGGTGPGGVITRDDVENAATVSSQAELVQMSRKRRAIARHMAESWATIPHVTVQADIRAENLLRARQLRARSIPIEAVVGRAVLPLLRRHSEFNAVVRGDSVEYRDRYDLGFAVDTNEGLMVVVVHNAETLSVEELAEEFVRLADGARAGTLTPDEAVGQTFTISNIGALGGGHGTPIIPMGTSAILSVGRALQVPVVEDGTLTIGMVAPIDLSYDHRLIDGGLGQRFLADLVEILESAGSDRDESTT